MVEENKKKRSLLLRQGLEIFSQVSTWIVFPIIGALIIGKALDTSYGTAPVIFLVSTGAAFLISIFGIVRVAIKYARKL